MTNSFVSSEHIEWTYLPETRQWRATTGTGRHSFSMPHCRTPDDYRKAANIVELAHPPRLVRKRVVAGDAWWIGTDRGEFLQFPFDNDVDDIRDGLAEFEDDVELVATITKHDLKALDDLRTNGRYEVSIDGGATWFPSIAKE